VDAAAQILYLYKARLAAKREGIDFRLLKKQRMPNTQMMRAAKEFSLSAPF